MTITELAIKRPSLIIVIFLALGLTGLFGYFQLRYELLPKVEPPFVNISIVYPGASPSEVETGVTKLVEDAVSSLEKISNIYAFSYEGLSTVSIEYNYSANADKAMQDVQRKINGIMLNLPRDIRAPVIQKWSFEDMPIVQMGVSSDLPSRDFYQFLKEQVQPAFSKLNGVGQVNLIGGDIREIKINLDEQKVRARGLSIAYVTQIIKASNLDFPTGTIKGKETEAVVRISGKFTSTDELRGLVLSRLRTGGEVRLGDVAEVEDGIQDHDTYSRINGKTTVGVNVLKQSDANAVEVSRQVREEIGTLEQLHKGMNLHFDIVADASLFTIEAADAVKKDLLVAILLVSAVMFLFLHDLRNSLIILIALVFGCYSGASLAFGGWIFTYATEMKLANETNAAYLTSVFWGALTLGRLVAIPLSMRLKPQHILRADFAGALVSLLAMLLWPRSLAAVIVTSAGLGFALASIYPTTMAFSGQNMVLSGRITGLFSIGNSAGAMRAATQAAAPPEEPPGTRAGSHGFFTAP